MRLFQSASLGFGIFLGYWFLRKEAPAAELPDFRWENAAELSAYLRIVVRRPSSSSCCSLMSACAFSKLFMSLLSKTASTSVLCRRASASSTLRSRSLRMPMSSSCASPGSKCFTSACIQPKTGYSTLAVMHRFLWLNAKQLQTSIKRGRKTSILNTELDSHATWLVAGAWCSWDKQLCSGKRIKPISHS